MAFLTFIVAILPVFLIGLYVYRKDKTKDCSKLLFQLFLFGVLSCFPASLIGSLLENFFPKVESMNFIQLIIYVFGTIALVEELCKWCFLYRISYNHNEFDSSYDMILYAVFVALGFACFENILYVFSYGISVGLVRAISAVPGHACNGILMGIYLGIAKIKEVNCDVENSNKYKFLSVFIPTIIHGIYDFSIFIGTVPSIIMFALFVIIVDIICIIKIKEISGNSIKFRYRNKYCPYCGTIVNSKYCIVCGNKNI